MDEASPSQGKSPASKGSPVGRVLWKDKISALRAVRRDGLALRDVAPLLRGDRDIVLEAVRQCGAALAFAAAPVRNDPQAVLEAVKADPAALQHASPSLRSNRRFVRGAVQENGGAVQFAAPKLRDDPKLAGFAARQDALALMKLRDLPGAPRARLQRIKERTAKASIGVGSRVRLCDGRLGSIDLELPFPGQWGVVLDDGSREVVGTDKLAVLPVPATASQS